MEGLRAVAASSILVYHCWLYGGPAETRVDLGFASTHVMRHLALGVPLFFTLSGFLLYRPFAAALLEGRERPGIRGYLVNRALRIVPAYWVILCVVAVVLGAATLPNTRAGLQTGSLATEPALLLLAATSLQSYSPTTLYLGIGPAWSLSVEAVFYVALPLLVLLGWRIGGGRTSRRLRWLGVLLPPAILFAVGVTGKVVTAYLVPATPVGGGDTSWQDVATFSWLAQADLFAGGMLLAAAFVEFEARGTALGSGAQAALVIVALLVAVPAIAMSYRDAIYPYAYKTLMSIVATLLVGVVLLASPETGLGARLRHGLERRWMVALGVISYSVFLWHEPLVHLVTRNGLTATGLPRFLVDVAIVGAVTVALSALTYRFVERPALVRKRVGVGHAPGAIRVKMPRDQTEAAP